MLHAQKMDIRFLLVRPVMIRKKKKLLQRVIPKELEYTGDTYCRICKTLLEEGKILPKLEHQWNDGTVTKRATYETAGELTYRCRKCAAKRIISIEKLAYPKAGTSYTISGNEYKVSKPGAEVILVKTSKTTKNVTVPAQIYAQGITYKVTSIGAKAFNNNKKLTKSQFDRRTKTDIRKN